MWRRKRCGGGRGVEEEEVAPGPSGGGVRVVDPRRPVHRRGLRAGRGVRGCQGLSGVVRGCHGLSWVVMGCQGLSSRVKPSPLRGVRGCQEVPRRVRGVLGCQDTSRRYRAALGMSVAARRPSCFKRVYKLYWRQEVSKELADVRRVRVSGCQGGLQGSRGWRS